MTDDAGIRRDARAHDHAALVQAVPYAAYLDMRIGQSEDGRRYRLPFRPDFIGSGRLQALHGGAVAAFLELAMQFDVLISQGQQRVPYPVDFSIDYWRSAQAQDTIAGCRLIRQGRRIAQVQAECWQADRDKPVAFARADFLLQDVSQDADPIDNGAIG